MSATNSTSTAHWFPESGTGITSVGQTDWSVIYVPMKLRIEPGHPCCSFVGAVSERSRDVIDDVAAEALVVGQSREFVAEVGTDCRIGHRQLAEAPGRFEQSELLRKQVVDNLSFRHNPLVSRCQRGFRLDGMGASQCIERRI